MPVLLAFLAGIADLAAESLVLRAGRFGLGASAQATALLLALALAGFGLGAALGRRVRGARSFALARGCAGLGALLGALAPLFAASVPGFVSGWLAPALAVISALTFAVPAGASLPLLFAWTEGSPSRAGLVFAGNALGAVLGAWLGGVFGPLFGGTFATALGVLALDLGLGLLGIARPGALLDRGAGEVWASRSRPRVAVAVAVSAGLATLAGEALFARLAPYFLDERSDAPATILSAALLGLSLGGGLGGLFLRRHKAETVLAAALAGLVFCGPVALLVLELLAHERWISAPATSGQWARARVLVGGALFAPVFVFTGLLSPLAFTFARGGGRDRAVAMNAAYAAGALLPAAALPIAFSWGCSTTLLLGGIGLAGIPAGIVAFGTRALPLLVPVVASVFLGSGPLADRVPPFRTRPWLETLEAREDAVGLAAAVADRRRQETTLFTNAFRAAATGDDYRYTRSLAHIPALLAARPPRRIAVIAVGTGSTAAAALEHRGIESLDLVEISKTVFDLLPRFRPASDALFTTEGASQPRSQRPAFGSRVQIVVDDGRRWIARDGPQLDLLLLEPLLPDSPAAFPFYTHQFYSLARRRLAPGGVLAQWIPIHVTEPLAFRSLVATFAAAFRHRTLFLVGKSLLLLGSDEALELTEERLHEALQQSTLAADLRRSGCASAGDLAAQCVLGDEGLDAFPTEHPVSDDFPRTERFGHISGRRVQVTERENLEALLRARESVPNEKLPGFARLAAGEQEARRAGGTAYLRARRALAALEPGEPESGDVARALAALSETTPHPFAALDGLRFATVRDTTEGRRSLASGDVRGAVRLLERAAPASRDPFAWLALALAYHLSDRAADAAFAAAVALALEDRVAEALPREWLEMGAPATREELANVAESGRPLLAGLPRPPETLNELAEGITSKSSGRRIVSLVSLARERDRWCFEIERMSSETIGRSPEELRVALATIDALFDPTLSGARARLAAAAGR